jgi:hypothetical protein
MHDKQLPPQYPNSLGMQTDSEENSFDMLSQQYQFPCDDESACHSHNMDSLAKTQLVKSIYEFIPSTPFPRCFHHARGNYEEFRRYVIEELNKHEFVELPYSTVFQDYEERCWQMYENAHQIPSEYLEKIVTEAEENNWCYYHFYGGVWPSSYKVSYGVKYKEIYKKPRTAMGRGWDGKIIQILPNNCKSDICELCGNYNNMNRRYEQMAHEHALECRENHWNPPRNVKHD